MARMTVSAVTMAALAEGLALTKDGRLSVRIGIHEPDMSDADAYALAQRIIDALGHGRITRGMRGPSVEIDGLRSFDIYPAHQAEGW